MSRGFDRYMIEVGAGNHPKFAGLTDGERCAHFLGVLAIAAKAPVRGCLLVGDATAEAIHVARAASVSVSVAKSAVRKLRALGVLLDDEQLGCLRVHDWEDCNPEPKDDPTRVERQRRYRERRRNATSNGCATGERRPENAGEVEVEVERLATLVSSRPDLVSLSEHLADTIRRGDPKARVAPQSLAWLEPLRLLVDRDGRTPAEVREAIDRAHADEFWQRNILSPSSLRSKFERLVRLKAKTAKSHKPGRFGKPDMTVQV